MLEPSKQPLMRALGRGLRFRCPHCGKGPLFFRYLKVSPSCPACGHDLSRYPADDGPAYFTILIVGHLIVAPMLFFPIIWEAPVAIILPVVLISLTVLTLLILPRIKGGVIGALYALKVTQDDGRLHTAEQPE